MTLIRDLKTWYSAMGTLPWYIKVWASLYPLPQILGGLFFLLTLPGLVIFAGRVLSGIIASQIHKKSPFSKLMGPAGHAHWLLIVPYLVYELTTQDLPTGLYWFVSYVVATTIVSLVIDAFELMIYVRSGHVQYRR